MEAQPQAPGQSNNQAIPTLAYPFSNLPTATPPAVSEIRSTVSEAGEPTEVVKPVTIYDETLDPNWKLIRSGGMEVDVASREVSNHGEFSMALQPQEGSSSLRFAVSRDSDAQYPREDVLGLSFWLYSRDESVELNDLVVSMAGSNAAPYWVPDDSSVTNIITPTFQETELQYLGVNQTIPPKTWTYIELLLEDRIYDAEYEYLTGFYIKNSEDFLHTVYVDEVQLLVLEKVVEEAPEATPTPTPTADPLLPVIVFQVDAGKDVHPISPLIYGISDADPEYLEALRPSLASWGGNPSTRYNWELGNAWNAGRDFFFRNGNYGVTSGSASDGFIENALSVGAEVRLTLPTLGWVAKNDDINTCSFPMANGECGDALGYSCEGPHLEADPNRANVPTDTRFVADWLRHLIQEKGFDLRLLAMDNEPELWGYTHYDVHPTCTTYEEILDKFLDYATVVRELAPDAEITGPVTSSWYYYWNSAAGAQDKAAHDNQDFLPWFLDRVREHDEEKNVRTLDVLDIHYYPPGVYNEVVDDATSALRLRSTRALWDPNYIVESDIAEPMYLIPIMKEVIDRHYPGTKLGISEWNWGAEATMNGALAIADVLGIFGREDLYFASYWVAPPLGSPGFNAFKMFTNYDGRGARFGDTSVWARSSDLDLVSGYSALDGETGNMHLMLINKQPASEASVNINLSNFEPQSRAMLYRYDENSPEEIARKAVAGISPAFELMLPPYSITLLVLEPK